MSGFANLPVLARQLAHDPLRIAEAILGPASSVARDQARFGKKGSLAVQLTGERRGLWYSHEAGVGGDLLDLIRIHHQLTTHEAVNTAMMLLGAAGEAQFTNTPPIPSEWVNSSQNAKPDRAIQHSPPALPDNAKSERALALWADARPLAGTLAEVYLEKRGFPAAIADAVACLRFHSALQFREASSVVRLPGLVTLMRHPQTGLPCGVQRTPLRSDGSKHPLGRRMLGNAGVAHVSPDEEVESGFFLVEGVEDALAARALGFKPVWATMSAGGIKRFPVLAGVDALTIIADGDDNGHSVNAARACARRWLKAGREVRIKCVKGSDLAARMVEVAGNA